MSLLHFAVDTDMVTWDGVRPVCGNDFRHTKKLTDDPAQVTCRQCLTLCGFEAKAGTPKMRELPANPILAHQRMIDAFCDDLWDMCLSGGKGTPRADAVCEISRQSRDGGGNASSGNPPPSNQ